MDTPSTPGSRGELSVNRSQNLVRSIPLTLGSVDPQFLDEDERGTLIRTWQILVRHKILVLLGVLLGGAIGFAITRAQTPLYRAHTSLEIQGLNDAFLNIRDTSAVSASFDVQTQIRALQSQTLRQRALRSVSENLEKSPRRADEHKSTLSLRHPVSREKALQQAATNLTVVSARDSRVIDILCDSGDPEVAAAFANTLTREYVEQILEWRWKTGEQTSDWLARTLEDVKAKLQQSEQRLQDYGHVSGLIFKDDKNTAAEDSLNQLQSELGRARSERLHRQAQWAMASASPPEHLPDVLANGTLIQYSSQLTELRRQYAEIRTAFTPDYPKAKRLQAQVAELEQAMKRDRTNIINRIRTEYESAVRRENLLRAAYDEQVKEVTAQAALVMRYAMLKREVDSNRRLYDNMLQKVKEAGIAAAMQPNNVRVVDPATAPSHPFRPRPLVNVGGGLMSGLFLGIFVVLLREFVDRSIRRPGDARNILNVPELGVIPSFKTDSSSALHRGRLSALRRNSDQRRQDRVELATWQQKPSFVAESFRAALASILFLHEGGERAKVIAVASPGSSEGKTNVISNLAIALTEINRRVILVDGDMRVPALHRVFDVPNNWGLSDLLKQEESILNCPVEGLVRKTHIPNLFMLPSGPGTVRTSRLLHSTRMTELLDRLRREFDTVLIDTPPMEPIPDARVLSRLADGVILVIRAGKTHREAALAAVQRFREDGSPVLGAILNHCNPRSMNGAYSKAPYGWDATQQADTH